MNQVLFDIADTKYYGMIRGIVMNNVDPNKRGACQIQFMPMFANIVTANLPWAIPATPLFDGAGTGTGCMVIPKIGTKVFGWFEQGDVYQPVYFAEAPDYVVGVPAIMATSPYPADYPNVKAWQTSGGFITVIDDAAPSMTFTHPSGTAINIDKNGNLNITGKNNLVITITGNTSINTTGNTTIEGNSGTVTIHGGQINLNAP